MLALLLLILIVAAVVLAQRGREPAAARNAYRWAIRFWVLLFFVLPATLILLGTALMSLLASVFMGFGVDIPVLNPILFSDYERRLFRANPSLFLGILYLLFVVLPIATWLIFLRRLSRR